MNLIIQINVFVRYIIMNNRINHSQTRLVLRSNIPLNFALFAWSHLIRSNPDPHPSPVVVADKQHKLACYSNLKPIRNPHHVLCTCLRKEFLVENIESRTCWMSQPCSETSGPADNPVLRIWLNHYFLERLDNFLKHSSAHFFRFFLSLSLVRFHFHLNGFNKKICPLCRD